MKTAVPRDSLTESLELCACNDRLRPFASCGLHVTCVMGPIDTASRVRRAARPDMPAFARHYFSRQIGTAIAHANHQMMDRKTTCKPRHRFGERLVMVGTSIHARERNALDQIAEITGQTRAEVLRRCFMAGFEIVRSEAEQIARSQR